jgi:hypothetical protein
MLPPEEAPHRGSGAGPTDLRHFEPALSIKQTAPFQERAPTTAAGLYVCRRFHINPTIADLVASLAGLGPQRRQA